MDYSRQLKLDFIDEQSQIKLSQACVTVFGAGGLGCTALPYLAAAGIGKITIVDPDHIETHNLHRQILFGIDDVGHSKAVTAQKKLQKNYPSLEVTALQDIITGRELAHTLAQSNVVLDCTDNAAFSLMLNQAALNAQTPAVFANASQMQGQLFVSRGLDDDACWCCLWGDAVHSEPTCDGLGVLGPVPGILGAMQAIEAIKLVVDSDQAPAIKDSLLTIDFYQYQTRSMTIARDPNCSHHQNVSNCNEMFNDSSNDKPNELSDAEKSVPAHFSNSLENAVASGYQVIDICDIGERIQPLPVEHEFVSMQDLLEEPEEFLQPETKYLLVCKMGSRSRSLQMALQHKGFSNVSAYAGRVD